jgi:hypothetical protein
MSQTTALALSIAVLGGIWTFLALGPLAPHVLVWAGFIAWGCYFHTGGDTAALQKTIVGMIYGAIIAGIALLLVVKNPIALPAAIAAPVYVAVTVFLLVIISKVELLSVVPANVYGFAGTAAYALQTPTANDVGPLASLTSPSLSNPVVILALSYVIGALFGMASGKIAAALTKE